MRSDHHARGGAAIGVLNRMDSWESNLVINLRLWCDGPRGQSQVWREYRQSLPGAEARNECEAFEILLRTVISSAQRPLVRHDVGCPCLGADEGIFLHLVRTASAGYLNDAALIGTLMVGPAHAEHIALLAAQVGVCIRQIHDRPAEYPPETSSTVVRLH